MNTSSVSDSDSTRKSSRQCLPNVSVESSSAPQITEDPAILNKLFSKVRHNRYKEVEAALDSGISPDIRDSHFLMATHCSFRHAKMATSA